jgi:hypothetical protein
MTIGSHVDMLNQLKNRLEIAGKQPKTANDCIEVIQKANLRITKPIDIEIIDQRLFGQRNIAGIKSYFCLRYITTKDKVSIEIFEH